MSRFGLVVHRERPVAAQLAAEIAAWLEAAGHQVCVDGEDAEAVPALKAWASEGLGPGLDLAISVGGDGTMLRTVQLVCRHRTAVLGVNVGHLGYLTVVEASGWRMALEDFLAGRYEVEERMTLDVSWVGASGRSPAGDTLTALNDAVVEKIESGHTVRVGVHVGSRPVISYAADAVIIATPTGSTAYNLSAGGPLVSPKLEATLITPVAAHSLLGRPLVVAGAEIVRVEVLAGVAVLTVDGRRDGRMAAGDAVECRAGNQPARLVTFGGRDFWSIVKAKFGLNRE